MCVQILCNSPFTQHVFFTQWSRSIECFYQLSDDNSAHVNIYRISKQKFEAIRPKLELLLIKTESGYHSGILNCFDMT